MNNLLLSFTNFSAEKLIDLMPDSKIPKKFIQNELNNVHIKFSTQVPFCIYDSLIFYTQDNFIEKLIPI